MDGQSRGGYDRATVRRLALLGAFAIAATVAAGALGAAPTAPAAKPKAGGAPWPAPLDPMRRTRMAGLKPEFYEHLRYHVHAHLDIFVNGRPVRVPAGIGIDIRNPGVQHGRLPDGTLGYGGINRCAAKPCISPLHTHDDTGILHTESATATPNRLGQFFTEWAVALSRHCVGGYCAPRSTVKFYVDGRQYAGDPRAIQLANLREIAIVIGTPPATIPSHFPTQ